MNGRLAFLKETDSLRKTLPGLLGFSPGAVQLAQTQVRLTKYHFGPDFFRDLNGGVETFHGRGARELAEAIYNHDLATVRRVLRSAGDLNHKHKEGETLFRFAVSRADASDASFEIVKAMLDALADSAEARERLRKQFPVGRFGKPEEVAQVVRFLVAEAPSYLTGEFISLRGGRL